MSKGIIAVALAALMLFMALPAYAQIQATSVEVRGTVYNESAPAGTFWDAFSFAGFWYDLKDNLKSETLTLTAEVNTSHRTIAEDTLNYTTTLQPKVYQVFDSKGQFVENGLDANGDVASPKTNGTHFGVVGWQAVEYIGLKGKANKLVKLDLEQSSTDKKSLQVGETWDMGDGYTLTAQSIDAKATPRQAWLVLSKDGNKLDDKVISQGGVYTYSTTVASVTDVPVFVTYVDSVFAGATSDMVQLKYTWLISQNVVQITGGDKYGNMEVFSSGDKVVTLKNTGKTIDLTRDSTVSIMGNMNFKVADSDTLRFYPMVEYVVGGNVTPTVTVTGGPTVTLTGRATPTGTAIVTGGATPPPIETAAAVTPTPTPTPTRAPGFDAILAISGLVAVAYFVLRQRK